MTLYDECIEALGKEMEILQGIEQEKISTQFQSTFPFTNWGRIDWDKINQFIDVDIEDILVQLKKLYKNYNNDIYIIWDKATLPIIQSNLDKVLKVIDDVTAVSFDTWVYSPSLGYVIEFYHEGDIRIGIK